MNRGLISILLLVVSNSFMTMAWYGHLRFNIDSKLGKWGLFGIILISWGIALFEYIFQVPANRIGYRVFGGPFSLVQLKVIQEVTTLLVFVVFSLIFFKQESFKLNHFIAFVFLILAVFFIFKD